MTRTAVPENAASVSDMRAALLLKAKSIWALPLSVISLLIMFMSLIYLGPIVDPTAHLNGLPVVVVDQDTGAAAASGRVNLGEQVVTALTRTPAVTSRLAITVTSLPGAQAEMNRAGAYATLVIPKGFTASVLALADQSRAAPLPTVELLTNDRAGSLGVSLAEGVLGQAVTVISRTIGDHLRAADRPGSAPSALLASPVTLTTVAYRPLPAHAGLGQTALYLGLLVMMCGFLGATIVNASVDSALGYASTDIGLRWRQRPPRRITRWQTLLAKWAVAVPCMLLATGVVTAVAAGILGMDAPRWFELWMFSWFAASVVAIGTLVFVAALGALGQVLAVLVFIYLGLASSGGTVPIEAMPGFDRFVASFEPLRQIVGANRAILYFNAAGDAGLDRGLILTCIGLALWVAGGIAVTRWYDRRGLDRIRPELLEYVQASARAFQDRDDADSADGRAAHERTTTDPLHGGT